MQAEDRELLSDNELIARLRPGHDRAVAPAGEAEADRRVLDELISRHEGWIFRLCLYELAERSLAADCAQEVMLQILKSIHRFDGRSELKTWMFTVAKRTIFRFRTLSKMRSFRFPLFGQEDEERAAAVEQAEEENAGPEALLVRSERSKELLRLVRRLPGQQRYAVELHYLEDLPLAEVAERLSCSEGTVRAHLLRARRRLGEFLTESAELRRLLIDEV